jgi:hypothetical protein
LRLFVLELNSPPKNEAIFMPFCRYHGLRSGCGASSGNEVSRTISVPVKVPVNQ